MPYIPGQTFNNPQSRGDYDTEGRAVLTDDQLAIIFIRYIVDVYHQTQHRGLLGEAPADALERLEGKPGLPPKFSQTTRRRAFGIRQERTVTARGIRFLGIDYGGDCEELQKIRKESGSNVRAFYIDPENLGTISVWNNDHWLEVKCSVENFHGIRLVEWIAVGKILRTRYSSQAEIKTSVIFEALSDIRKRSNEIQEIMGVLPQMYTAEDLERLDRELYWGLSIFDDKPTDIASLQRAESGLGYVIGGAVAVGRPDKILAQGDDVPPATSIPDESPVANSGEVGSWRGEDAMDGCDRDDRILAENNEVQQPQPTAICATAAEDDDDWWREEDEK